MLTRLHNDRETEDWAFLFHNAIVMGSTEVTRVHMNRPAPAGWKAGAKALAQFQATHHGVAKGGMVDGGPRKGSKYATLTDILAVCAKGAEHGSPIQVKLVWSAKPFWHGEKCFTTNLGESIYTEHPIPVPDKGLPGQRQQDLGGDHLRPQVLPARSLRLVCRRWA